MSKGLLNRLASLKLLPENAREDREVVVEPIDKRGAPRVNTYKDSTLYLTGNRKMRIVIHDMSETGLRIGCDSGISLPDYVDVMVMGQRYTCRVVWRRTFEAGLEYISLVS